MENNVKSSVGPRTARAEFEVSQPPSRELDFNHFADRLRFLHGLLVDPYGSFQEQCCAYLKSGCKMLAVNYGALVQRRGKEAVYFMYSRDAEDFSQIETAVDEAPFPAFGHETAKTLLYPGADDAAVNLSKMAYNGEAITRYLSSQVTVSGNSFGVLCFFSVRPIKAQAFASQDIETVELMAEGVARMIELQTAQPKETGVALGGFATPGVKTLEEYIAQARLPDVYGVPGRVVEVLQRRIGHSSLAIDHIAEELNLSKRTLQRRLQQQHINFAQLRDQVRFHYSIDYLIEQTMSIDGISASLDFSDRTSFTNAFKRWTGLSPSTFRKLFRDYT